jgi:hypothetical protein
MAGVSSNKKSEEQDAVSKVKRSSTSLAQRWVDEAIQSGPERKFSRSRFHAALKRIPKKAITSKRG